MINDVKIVYLQHLREKIKNMSKEILMKVSVEKKLIAVLKITFENGVELLSTKEDKIKELLSIKKEGLKWIGK